MIYYLLYPGLGLKVAKIKIRKRKRKFWSLGKENLVTEKFQYKEKKYMEHQLKRLLPWYSKIIIEYKAEENQKSKITKSKTVVTLLNIS